MKCDCYDRAFWPVISLLEDAAGIMFFKTPDYEIQQQRIHDIITDMNLRFKCIDDCWRKVEEE